MNWLLIYLTVDIYCYITFLLGAMVDMYLSIEDFRRG